MRAFLFGNIMFYLGVAVGYFLVFPLAVRFLADYQLSSAIRPIVSLESYMDNFFMLLVMMGAIFELPLLAWLMGRMGILTRDFFGKYRRHAIVALMIVAAFITPTGDPSHSSSSLSLSTLFEMSARLTRTQARGSRILIKTGEQFLILILNFLEKDRSFPKSSHCHSGRHRPRHDSARLAVSQLCHLQQHVQFLPGLRNSFADSRFVARLSPT